MASWCVAVYNLSWMKCVILTCWCEKMNTMLEKWKNCRLSVSPQQTGLLNSFCRLHWRVWYRDFLTIFIFQSEWRDRERRKKEERGCQDESMATDRWIKKIIQNKRSKGKLEEGKRQMLLEDQPRSQVRERHVGHRLWEIRKLFKSNLLFFDII